MSTDAAWREVEQLISEVPAADRHDEDLPQAGRSTTVLERAQPLFDRLSPSSG